MPESLSAATPPSTGSALPILILSCYRTGSTLLRYILDTHPEVYSPPEVFLGQVAADLAQFVAGLTGQVLVHSGPLTEESMSKIRGILCGMLDEAAAERGKRVWCEKTPSNLMPANLAILRLLFPAARKLCLHRHCLDVVQSLLKMMNAIPEVSSFLLTSQGHPVAAAISYWCQRTSTLLELEAEEPSRCWRLRYEDMVSDPAAALEPVFHFLGLSWDRSILDSVFEARHDRGMQDHYITFTQSIHSGSVGSGRGVSLAGVPERTLESMDGLLQKLGYPDRPAPVVEPARPPETSASAATATQDVRWFFESHLPERIRAEPDLCASFGTLYQFIVGGGSGGAWVVDPRRGQISPGRSSAVCNVEVSAADLFSIAHGVLHPWKAAEQGRLRLRGDIRMQELEKLVRLLRLAATSSTVPQSAS